MTAPKIFTTSLLALLCAGLFIASTSAQQPTTNTATAKNTQQQTPPAAPTNLKVLPKKIDHETLIGIMRTWSKSLGVHCDFCHVSQPASNPGERPKMDFASDAKVEKLIARKMLTMTKDINTKYLAKMADKKSKNMELREFQPQAVSCATCHMGSPKPLVSADSLPKKG